MTCTILLAITAGAVSGPIGVWLAHRIAYPLLARRWPHLYG